MLDSTIARNDGGDDSGVWVTGTWSSAAFTTTIIVGHSVGISVARGSTVTRQSTLYHVNGSYATGAGLISSVDDHSGAPAFRDDGYRRSGSKAIDQGVDAGARRDIDGGFRPAGMGFDDEAYEYRREWQMCLPLTVRWRR